MDHVKERPKVKQKFFLFGFAWILLWIIPWGKALSFEGNLYLIFFVDMLKLGIALAAFILPGAFLYILARHESDSLSDSLGILPIGFALSVVIITVDGLFGRIFGFSFTLVKIIFMLVGLVEFFLLSYFKQGFSIGREHFSRLFQNLFENIPLLLALILATAMTFNEYLFFIDDTTYQAYSTNWQYAIHLGFNNIVHQVNIIESERFWLALYPMMQSLLSNLSGVPGILLFSSYLEIFLVPLAVLTMYWFANVLGLSRRMAGLSVLIQVLLYTWMIGEAWPVGFWFFLNLIEDKVSAVFFLAPVFFYFTLKFLQMQTKINLMWIFFIGIALVLTHPVILFFTCAIATGLALFSWLSKRTGLRETLHLAAVFFILLLPYLIIRLSNHPSQAKIAFDGQSASTTFQIGRYTNVISNIFYGLNPEVLKFFDISPENPAHSVFQIFRWIPVVLVLIAAILAFTKLKDGGLYWYILTCVLLVVFATIPYTGWILGYFVSARMLSRASWFSPLGLSGALFFTSLLDRLTIVPVFGKIIRSYTYKSKKITSMTGVVFVLLFTGIMLIVPVSQHVKPYFITLGHYRQLAQIGAYIDKNSTSPTTVIALNYWDIQMLPGVSAHANLISFREENEQNPHNYFLSVDEIHARMDASNTIRSLDSSISIAKRCALLSKYDVKFVLADRNNATTFANIVSACRRKISDVFDTKDMVLLEFK